MDQWPSKFSESFGLDRPWSIECSSLLCEFPKPGPQALVDVFETFWLPRFPLGEGG